MRIFTILLILMVVTSQSLLANIPDSSVMAERDYYFKKYRSVRDTMTMNTWLNLKRLSDNLEQVVQRDQELLEHYSMIDSSANAVSINDQELKEEMSDLQIKMEQLEARAQNDMQMIWLLKTAAGLMIVFILILIYSLFSGRSKLNRLKELYHYSEKTATDKRNENILLENELDKLRQREQEFRAELEKGLISHQEKLMMLQKKNDQLELALKSSQDQVNPEEVPMAKISRKKREVPELPTNESDVKALLLSLSEERNSLMNLAGKLQKQLQTEKTKFQKLMQKLKSITGSALDENV
jgi:chromosome segregation ATPase